MKAVASGVLLACGSGGIVLAAGAAPRWDLDRGRMVPGGEEWEASTLCGGAASAECFPPPTSEADCDDATDQSIRGFRLKFSWMNRRIRARTSGGVVGGPGDPAFLPDFS
jgi:hypothetical protein